MNERTAIFQPVSYSAIYEGPEWDVPAVKAAVSIMRASMTALSPHYTNTSTIVRYHFDCKGTLSASNIVKIKPKVKRCGFFRGMMLYIDWDVPSYWAFFTTDVLLNKFADLILESEDHFQRVIRDNDLKYNIHELTCRLESVIKSSRLLRND